MIAYGIYGDVERADNDYQVILQYDPSVIDNYGKPLNQATPHHSGPAAEARYFVYTGNTTYGVQNLEYDPSSCTWLVAVYVGKKPQFPNYTTFFIDGSVTPKQTELTGRAGEQGLVLTLANLGEMGEAGISGCRFPDGSTGIYADGKGSYFFSKPSNNKEAKTHSSTVTKYKMDKSNPQVFVTCES